MLVRPRARRAVVVVASLALTASCADPALSPILDEASASDAVPTALAVGGALEEAFALEGDFLVSRPLEAPEGATRVGFMIDLALESSDAPLRLQARGTTQGGERTAWIDAEVTWREGVYAVARADLPANVVEVEVRLPAGDRAAIAALKWEAVVPFPAAADGDGIDVVEQDVEQGLVAGLVDIGVKTRGQWGARATRCTTADATKTRMAVHHTVTAPSLNGTFETRLRQIQSFHMDSRGYCDVAYHFLVTTDGRLWEGRPMHLLGAHASNNNQDNIGVSFVGCFHTSSCGGLGPNVPPERMIEAGGRIIRKLSALHGIPRDAARVKGHRDHAGTTPTSCPGDHLHARLPALRSYDPPAAPAPPPPPPPPAPVGCDDVARVSGDTRHQTAAKLSAARFPGGASVVVLASGADHSPDAVVAGPLGKKLGGPVLLTAADALPQATRDEILRLGADHVVVVGGVGAISAAVESAVRALGVTTERLSGDTRYQTAAAVARRIGAPGGLAFVASGESGRIIDGLAAAAAASATSAPLLWTRAGDTPPSTAVALADLGVTRTLVVGGPAAIPAARLAELPNGVRIFGDTRYETAVAVAEAARVLGAGSGRVYLSRGDKTVDAVSASATGRLLLLSPTDQLAPPTKEFLRLYASKATLMGGTGALSAAVEAQACEALR